MKKKIYKYVSVAVIAVAMVVSMRMSKVGSATDYTLKNTQALACESMEGLSGQPILFMHLCLILDGNHFEGYGCADGGGSCSGYNY